MARPKKRRFCRRYNADRIYKPQGIPLKEIEYALNLVEIFQQMFE